MANETRKLRPCDCSDKLTAEQLETQGININGSSITVEPSVVVLKINNTTIKIPMVTFTKLAEWYLAPQIMKENKN